MLFLILIIGTTSLSQSCRSPRQQSNFQQLVDMYSKSTLPNLNIIIDKVHTGRCYHKPLPNNAMNAGLLMRRTQTEAILNTVSSSNNKYEIFIPISPIVNYNLMTPDQLTSSSLIRHFGYVKQTWINVLPGITPDGGLTASGKIKFHSDNLLILLMGNENNPAMACHYNLTTQQNKEERHLL